MQLGSICSERGTNVNQVIFMTKMKALLEREEPFSMKTRLEEIDEWDSLSIAAFRTMVGPNVKPIAIHEAKTVGDLFDLCN